MSRSAAGLVSLGLLLVMTMAALQGAGPALASTSGPWLSYAVSAAHNARVPATSVVLTAHSSSRPGTVVLSAGSTVLGTSSTARSVRGGYETDIRVDLSPYSGRTALAARFLGGAQPLTARWVVNVVPGPGSLTGRPGADTGGATVAAPSPSVPTPSVPTPSAPVPSVPVPSVPAPAAPPVAPPTTSPVAVPEGAAPAAEAGPVLSQPGPIPGPDNTGVPVGQALTPSGPLTVVTPGSVISNLDITGCVTILANNVTLRNVRITCTSPSRNRAVFVGNGISGLVIEDSEIDGTGTAEIGIGWSNYTLRRTEIRRTCDGARVGTNVLIEDSWIHDLVRTGTLHCDAVQTTEGANIVVRRSHLDPRSETTPDLNNAAVMLGTETGTQRLDGALFADNWMAGGNYSVNVRGDATFTGVTFTGNEYLGLARYGPAIAPPGVVFSGNHLSDGSPWRVQVAR